MGLLVEIVQPNMHLCASILLKLKNLCLKVAFWYTGTVAGRVIGAPVGAMNGLSIGATGATSDLGCYAVGAYQ